MNELLEKELDELPESWIAKSGQSPSYLSAWFDRHLTKLKIKTHLNEWREDEHYSISFSGAYISFEHTGYGCKIEVVLRDKTDKVNRLNIVLFWLFWKSVIDKDYIWGGPYAKVLQEGDTVKTMGEIWSPCDHLPVSISDQERKAVELWCENKTAKEISDWTKGKGLDFWKVTTVHNKISKLRRSFPDARIPYDKERK
ncbi:MAG TPA: hypothetical protein VJ987_04780 [Anaerolineales bacterium]|nr:hypothetical protein [Anaerolineales bacterium]